jgi:surface-anchored protein
MPCKKQDLKDTNMKNLAHLTIMIGACLLASAPEGRSVTTFSNGHIEIFEVEYEQSGTNTPTLHLGVHTDRHYEPGDVLLEVGNTAFTSTALLPSGITGILGFNAWILPADLEEAANLGVLEAGVGKVGFPDNNPVTFSLVGAGPNNPGAFALFTAGNAIRLSATGDTIGTNSFSITTGHIHYNWGFSAPGTYTFDLKASYTDAVFGFLESATETYTFNVIPEPSSGALVVAGMAVVLAVRRKLR